MLRKSLLLIGIVATLISSAYPFHLQPIEKKDGQRVDYGIEQIPYLPYNPSRPETITDSPGDIIGWTQFDLQSIGSAGRRIALDYEEGVHFAWTKGVNSPDFRWAYFNYCHPYFGCIGPVQISQYKGAGFVQLSMLYEGRAVVAYYSPNHLPRGTIVCAVDLIRGFGIFNYFTPPSYLDSPCINPCITIDRNDNIHIVSGGIPRNPGGTFSIAYTRSSDEGDSWTTSEGVDKTSNNSYIIVSSKVSDRVAIVYTRPVENNTQWKNDVIYIESEDGIDWDFRHGRINITEYGQDGDSLFAYTDVAAIYDYNDNLQIVWNALYVGEENVYYPVFLYHYSLDERYDDDNERPPMPRTITQIAVSDTLGTDCDAGAWNLPICKMSLGYTPGDYYYGERLYVIYTRFSPYDCSAGGFANGDIFMQCLIYQYSYWSDPVNLTDSPSPDCQPGECDSDNWASIAESIDDLLHIIYINDKDAGAAVCGEGSVTDNPVMYLADYIWWTGVEDEEDKPAAFRLASNFPNPFNAKTNIEFELLKSSHVALTVYDITGSKVATLVNGQLEAGLHSVSWNADGFASGIYFAKLTAGRSKSSMKLVLLK